MAAIIDTHKATKNANEPSRVATPMSIPFICLTATTQDAAASPSVAVSAVAVAAVLALASPQTTATLFFKSMIPPSLLNEFLQTVEGFVPPLRDVLEIAPRRFHLLRLEFPDALSAAPHIRDEPSRGEYVQVLGNGLARDSRPGG
jgi:hypothetical protein